MAKKSIHQLEQELNANIEALTNKYVDLILHENEVEDKDIEKVKEDKRQLKQRLDAMKRDLKFVQSMKGKVDKKAEKEKQKGQKEMVSKLTNIKNSIGDLIADIPKIINEG